MKITQKLLLPKWVAWFILGIIIISVLILYYEYRAEQGVNLTSTILMLTLLLFILFVIFFVVYKQIPYAYLVDVRK
mgnify:CR=1 FL=1